MEPYFYRANVKKSVDEDNAEIVAGFRDIIKRGLRVGLRLVNYYKGLPISYPATLVEVSGDVLELDVHPQQAVALEATWRTFVKCGHFHLPLLAEVKDADVRRMMASLHNFRFVEIMAEQRISLRLQLTEPCDAEIIDNGATLEGKVLDISLGGFSIRTNGGSPPAKGAEVLLRVKVPNLLQNSHTALEIQATVVDNVREEAGDICRVSISSDPHVEGVISRFIFQRQVDLIRELKEQS